MSSERFFRVRLRSIPHTADAKVFDGRTSDAVQNEATWRLRVPVDMQAGEIWRMILDSIGEGRPWME